MTEKNEIYWKILNSAISFDIKKGHLKWSITDIAKSSKISRTLIYYYFGKSKENILLEAITLFGQELSGNTTSRKNAWISGDIASTLCASQALMSKVPEIRVFYFLRRNEPSVLGKAIFDFENVFLAKIQSFFPQLNKNEVEALFALFLGIAWTPNLSGEAVQSAVNIILNGVKNK